jgi:hypothetical protein
VPGWPTGVGADEVEFLFIMLPVVLLPVVLLAIILLPVVWLPGIIVCADADIVLKFIAAITPTTNTTATILVPNLKVSFMPQYVR